MKEDRFTAAAMEATEATRGTVLAATAATVATAASEDIRDTVSAEATATRDTVLAVTAVLAATAASEDIRGTVLAAMAEATAATRSIIIIGTANISDHSGKALLEQAQECSSHVLAAVLRLEQNHQVHRTFL